MEKPQQEIVIATIMRRHGSSGLQTYINTLAGHINQSGGCASVITPFDYFLKPLIAPVFGVRRLVDYISDEVSTWWYEYWHYRFLKLALARKLKENAKKQVRTILYAQCPLSAKACLETKFPDQKVFMVVHFNVSQADEWADKGKIKRNGRMFRQIRNREQAILPAVDGVVFVSNFMKKQIMENVPLLAEHNTACIPCFTNRPVATGDNQKSLDLISIGTLETRKNQAYLLKVLGVLKSKGHILKLTLVGDGRDKQSLKDLSVELGIDSQVNFMGYQPNGAAFIPAHRIYVHSALIENLPISLLEAQACALPILAPAVGGIPEIISDGREGFFWPLNDPQAGAERVLQLILNADVYRAMSDAAALKFQSTFETEVVVRQLMKFWAEH